MARLATQMAIASSHIKAEMVEISEFPRVAERFAIRAVPTTVIDDRVLVMGALPEKAFLEQVMKAVEGSIATSTVGGAATPTQVAGSQPQPSSSSAGGRIIIP